MTDLSMFWDIGLSVWLLPLIFICPGYGFARRLTGTDRLGVLLHAVWISLAFNWIDVAVIREVGMSPEHHGTALLIGATVWTVTGLVISRGLQAIRPMSPGERIGTAAVVAAVIILGLWRSSDIARPLQGYWHLEGAEEWRHEALPIRGVSPEVTIHGTADSGAYSLAPKDGRVTLQAEQQAKGRITLAVQGPVGSYLALGERRNSVAASMVGVADEGPVRRYLDHGVAGMSIDVNLAEGETLEVQASGERVYVMTGADAVWALHAEGTLRFIHYYQILNQVENQVWADEMLQDRWATLNQPPGWSPTLTSATVLLNTDLPAAGVLFLFVVFFAGVSAVRLAHVLAPQAPTTALLLPGVMVLSHGLLMLEPGSQNFPDSLFAVAVLACATAIAEGRLRWIAGLSIAAGMLRWPGVVLSAVFILTWWRMTGSSQLQALKRIGQLVLVGAGIAAVGAYTGVLQDLLFILYFETFPEHWHGEYSLTRLIPRVPGFYALWIAYTGGGLLLACGSTWLAAPSEVRQHGRWLLLSIGLYSLMLATIDHHPTHYFLPLIWVATVALMCGAAATSRDLLRQGLPVLALVGTVYFLASGDVGLQPVEDMVSALEAALNPA